MKKSYQTPPLSKMLFGWSKWGGGNYGIFREITEEWNCQLCGEKQIIGMPQYFFPFDNYRRDFLRVCSVCWHDLKIAEIKTLKELGKKIGLEKFKQEVRVKVFKIDLELKTPYSNKL
uniref:Uncharacterized protein n=1 Tax=candidate division CPR3 bacterium TaxID=2268181 RepID=A0A7C5YUN7_UNCC3